MKQRNQTTKENLYTRVTETIITDLKNGVRPWHKPWNVKSDLGPVSIPLRHNHLPYRGINILLLWMEALDRGFTAPLWMTYRQATALGGQVRRGESGSPVVFAKAFDKFVEDENGDEKLVRRSCLRRYTVFNVDQVDGLPREYYPIVNAQISNDARIAKVEAFVASIDVDFRQGGSRAYYNMVSDHIQLPPFEVFESPERYYSTLCHELIHWTGPRLQRDFGSQTRGDAGYAMEELVAELGAAFLCAKLGISPETRKDHAAYIGSWLQMLHDNHKLIFRAAAHAQRAVDFLLPEDSGSV